MVVPKAFTGKGGKVKIVLAGLCLAVLLAVPGLSLLDEIRHQREIDFNEDIRPILNARCTVCHGGVKREADLSLLFRAEALRPTDSGRHAIVPGSPGESELIRRVKLRDPRQRMPQEGDPLTADEIRKLELWIAQGAHWGDHWAYVPPKSVELPEVSDPAWPRNGIDSFILARLDREGLAPSPEADCHTLIRRLGLDLIGLPPTPEEAERFCKDPSPEAYEKVVDRLLASPHFGERWAAMWLDLARYADTKGYEKDTHRTIWKYRDWVIRAFNEDKPFDRFTIEQLAGDLLPEADLDPLIATAFHRNTMTNTEGGTKDEEFRIAAVVDRVNATMEIWQGTTLQCVQCHSHPYDPFRQEEYYGLFAFFNNTKDADRADENPVLPTLEDADKQRRADRILEEIRRIEAEMDARADRPETLQSLEEWVEGAREALRFSENRDLFGVKEIPAESEIEEIIRMPPEEREPHRQRLLMEHYMAHAPEFTDRREELTAHRQALRELNPILTPILQELPPEHRRVTRVLERGSWLVQGKAVEPGLPEALNPMPEGAPMNRLGVAQWLTSPENPLAARVTVNRFWHEIFGTGIVETLEDFGTQGARPSHPELLDWLALRFMHEHRWSVKGLLKEIVLSSTYRQSSRVRTKLVEKDPRNRLLARAPRLRLSAEQVRDQALAVAGLLSPKMFGPSVMPPQPEGIWNSPYGERDKWLESEGEDRYRRALYTYWKRTSPYPSMVIFDSPAREVTVSRRVRTATPLQALVTLNDPVYVEAARGLTARMNREAGGSVENRIHHGYRLALLRPPDAQTLADLLELYRATLAHYEATPEEARLFTAVGTAEPEGPESAALMVVAGAILNLDEFLNKE